MASTSGDSATLPAQGFTPPDESDRFVSVTLGAYRKARQCQMDRLRAIYDYSVWFDDFALRLQRGECKVTVPGHGVNAFTPCERGSGRHSGLGSLVEHMREHRGLGWRYSTLRAYRVLAGFDWEDVAACGSVRKAIQWARDQRRTPFQQSLLEERREMNTKDSLREAIRGRDKLIRELRAENAVLKRRLAALEKRLERGDNPLSLASPREKNGAPLKLNNGGNWY